MALKTAGVNTLTWPNSNSVTLGKSFTSQCFGFINKIMWKRVSTRRVVTGIKSVNTHKAFRIVFGSHCAEQVSAAIFTCIPKWWYTPGTEGYSNDVC